MATWLAIVVAGILLGIFARWLFPAQIEADHPKNLDYQTPGDRQDQKIGTINGYEAENFCVTVVDSSMSFDDALNHVKNTLLHSDGWDGLKAGKVMFSGGSTPCDQLPSISNIEIQYRVKDSTPDCGGLNCVSFLPDDEYFDTRSGQTEYRHAYVIFNTTYIAGSQPLYQHTVNHETGHALGLCDGGPGADEDKVPPWLGCQSDPDHYDCVVSIMHSEYYGCTNRTWPTSLDLDSVESLIPGGGGSGGGGGKGFSW